MKQAQIDLKIKTLKVEIKVLTVDGKRFTKSVFTQLQDVFLFGPDMEQYYEIVGYVNLPDARWLILQDNTGLYKCKCQMAAKHDGYNTRSRLVHSGNGGKGIDMVGEWNGDTYRYTYRYDPRDLQAREMVMALPTSMQLFISI